MADEETTAIDTDYAEICADEERSNGGVITRIGARKFNENYLRQDRKIVILGMKLGLIDSAYLPPEDGGVDSWGRTELISEQYGTVMPPEDSEYVSVSSMSTEPQGISGDRLFLNIGFLFSRDTVQPRKPEDGSAVAFDRFNELGVFAQVFQSATDWAKWGTSIDYKTGDLVKHEVDGKYKFYRCTEEHTSGEESPDACEDTLWAEYPYPGARTIKVEDRLWIPVPGEDPFLLYYVVKSEYPLCLEYGHYIRYMLAIELLSATQARVFCANVEDAVSFPEIQLAYLATLSNSLRSARDVHRENAVLMGSRGRWEITPLMKASEDGTLLWAKDDVVVYDNRLWKANMDITVGTAVFGWGEQMLGNWESSPNNSRWWDPINVVGNAPWQFQILNGDSP